MSASADGVTSFECRPATHLHIYKHALRTLVQQNTAQHHYQNSKLNYRHLVYAIDCSPSGVRSWDLGPIILLHTSYTCIGRHTQRSKRTLASSRHCRCFTHASVHVGLMNYSDRGTGQTDGQTPDGRFTLLRYMDAVSVKKGPTCTAHYNAESHDPCGESKI